MARHLQLLQEVWCCPFWLKKALLNLREEEEEVLEDLQEVWVRNFQVLPVEAEEEEEVVVVQANHLKQASSEVAAALSHSVEVEAHLKE